MGLYDNKPCPCGSGKERFPQFDGHTIFLTFTCTVCHDGKMKKYRPDIKERYTCDEPIDAEEY